MDVRLWLMAGTCAFISWMFVYSSWLALVPVMMMMLRLVVNMEEKEGGLFP